MNTATAKRVVIGSMLVIVLASTVRRIASDKGPTVRAPIGGLFAAAGLTALAGPAPQVAAQLALIALVAELVVDGPYLIDATKSATGEHKPTAPIAEGVNEAGSALVRAVEGLTGSGTRWWSSSLGSSVGAAGSAVSGAVSGATSAAGMVKFKSAAGQTITCAPSVADALAGMIAAAKADGVTLTGSCWRSPETTAKLRIKNGCPDVNVSPASSCRIPTARPGQSMHEKGLAIDFDRCGYGSAAHNWLKANASRYGFRQLPTESWHWSTNGS